MFFSFYRLLRTRIHLPKSAGCNERKLFFFFVTVQRKKHYIHLDSSDIREGTRDNYDVVVFYTIKLSDRQLSSNDAVRLID